MFCQVPPRKSFTEVTCLTSGISNVIDTYIQSYLRINDAPVVFMYYLIASLVCSLQALSVQYSTLLG